MSDFRDFDQWTDEQTDTPIRFKLLDDTWEVPAQIDAVKILRMQRLEAAAARLASGEDPEKLAAEFAGDLSSITYEGLARELVGDTILDTWLARGIKLHQLQAVTRWLYATYTGQDPTDGPGEARRRIKQPADHKPKKPRSTSS